MEENLAHMTDKHSFFIPDVEFLVDLRGLVDYLGQKVAVENMCLYCNGKGRSFHSIDSVRDHMVRVFYFFVYANSILLLSLHLFSFSFH